MTQMQIPINPMGDLVRELGAALPDPSTVTSFIVIADSACADDNADLRIRRAVVNSRGLCPAARIEMLEAALAFEREQLDQG